MIRYTCYPHYNLHGPVTRTCLADSSWSKKAPECLSEYIERSLIKQPRFRDTTTGFPAKWRLRNDRRNSILMTSHYPDLGSILIGCYKIYLIQSEALTRSRRWHAISMEFVCWFLGRHFAGKPVVVPQNVGCFLELHWMRIIRGKTNWDSLGFWIPLCGFRIPGTGFWYLSVELGFWFQLLDGFRIPWAVFRIPTIKRLLFVFVFYNKFEVKSFYQLFWTFPFIIPASLRELPEHQENRA